jgi:hypothetical protein
LAATTTQFALSSSVMPYASQNCAVSASAGSICATRTWSAQGSLPSAASTAGASRPGRDSAG